MAVGGGSGTQPRTEVTRTGTSGVMLRAPVRHADALSTALLGRRSMTLAENRPRKLPGIFGQAGDRRVGGIIDDENFPRRILDDIAAVLLNEGLELLIRLAKWHAVVAGELHQLCEVRFVIDPLVERWP